jgi:hypothetical protein
VKGLLHPQACLARAGVGLDRYQRCWLIARAHAVVCVRRSLGAMAAPFRGLGSGLAVLWGVQLLALTAFALGFFLTRYEVPHTSFCQVR